MLREHLKIPKNLRKVTLWVHPEGLVVGSLFLRLQSANMPGEEDPLELLNTEDVFLVVKIEQPDELRFYNKSSVLRVEYDEDTSAPFLMSEPLQCTLHLMDGSFISGIIRKPLSPDRSRLFDFLNLRQEQFMKIRSDDGRVCIVNKSYIVSVTP
jgi:hypothetical protein